MVERDDNQDKIWTTRLFHILILTVTSRWKGNDQEPIQSNHILPLTQNGIETQIIKTAWSKTTESQEDSSLPATSQQDILNKTNKNQNIQTEQKADEHWQLE